MGVHGAWRLRQITVAPRVKARVRLLGERPRRRPARSGSCGLDVAVLGRVYIVYLRRAVTGTLAMPVTGSWRVTCSARLVGERWPLSEVLHVERAVVGVESATGDGDHVAPVVSTNVSTV